MHFTNFCFVCDLRYHWFVTWALVRRFPYQQNIIRNLWWQEELLTHTCLILYSELRVLVAALGHLQTQWGDQALVPVISWFHHRKGAVFALPVLCAGNSPIIGEFHSQRPWRGALMFSLICAWINRWANNREAGDLRRHQAHYDVSVIIGDRHQGPLLLSWINFNPIMEK